MRYLLTGIVFALFSVSLIWFSGAAHSADDLDDLFGEKQSEVEPFAADEDEFGDEPVEDDPFGGVEAEDNPFGGGEAEDDPFGDEPARRSRGRSRGRRNDQGDSRQAPKNVETLKKITAGKKSAAEITIRAELDKTSPSIDFADTSLTDVISILRDNHEDINVVLDEAALDLAGIDPETPINKTLNGVKLRSVLRLILKGLDLTYVIKDEVLLITTVDEAKQLLAMEVYPVHDMLNKKDPNKSANALIDAITSNVNPESWEQVGGTGAVSFFQGNLIISQTLEVHQGVTALLEKLREGIKIVGGPIYPETFNHGSSGGRNADIGGMPVGDEPAAVVANSGRGDEYGGGGGYGREDKVYGGGYGDEGYGGSEGNKRSRRGH